MHNPINTICTIGCERWGLQRTTIPHVCDIPQTEKRQEWLGRWAADATIICHLIPHQYQALQREREEG